MTIRFPELYCPFETRPSPRAAEAERTMLERVAAIEPAFADGLARLRLGELAGRMYPTLDHERLVALLLRYAWACFYDDLCDRKPQPDQAEVRVLQRRIVEVVYGSGVRADETPLVRIVGASVDALAPFVAGRDRSAYHHAMQQWFAANVFEMEQRRRGVPPLALHRGMRPYTVGAYEGLEYDLLILEIELAPHVRRHPLVEQMDRFVANYAGWTNDIYSSARGSGIELVSVLRTALGLGHEDALERVAQMCRAEALAYVELRPRLGSLGVEVDDELIRYLDHQERMMGAFVAWCQSSARYHGR